MTEETKKCPYCGEEIIASAMKCKHCGEWLNQSSPSVGNDSFVPQSQSYNQQSTPPSYNLLSLFCIFGFIVAVISFLQDLGLESTKGKAGFVAFIVNSIPTWLVVLLSGVIWTYIFIGFKRHLTFVGRDRGVPMTMLIYTTVVGYVLIFISSVIDVDNLNETVLEMFGIIIIIITIIEATLYIIAGVNLKNELKQHGGLLAGFFLIPASYIFSIIALVEDGEGMSWVSMFFAIAAELIMLYTMRRYFESKENEQN